MLAVMSELLGNTWWTVLVGVVGFCAGVYFSNAIKSRLGK